jgi:hypothetical protein
VHLPKALFAPSIFGRIFRGVLKQVSQFFCFFLVMAIPTNYGVTFSFGAGVASQDVKPVHRKAKSLFLVEA